MTSDLIRQLRKLERDDISGLPRAEFVARFHLKQLLDEREALLGFLKSLDQALGFEVREIWADAQAAIAKAEAP